VSLDHNVGKGHVIAMLIYKIFRDAEWRELRDKGVTQGAPVDLADGFIHFSTGAQIAETCARHFSGEDGLQILMLDSDDLGEQLRWETSRGGDKFPHLYSPLWLSDVIWHKDLILGRDGHEFPEGVT